MQEFNPRKLETFQQSTDFDDSKVLYQSIGLKGNQTFGGDQKRFTSLGLNEVVKKREGIKEKI